MTEREALKLALEALEVLGWQPTEEAMDYRDNAIDAIKEALAQPEQIPPSAYSNTHQPEQEPVAVKDNTYGYAKSLAEAIFRQHFSSDEHYASGRIVWGVNDTVIGILTQIDNMVAGMVRRSAQPEQEPVAWFRYESFYEYRNQLARCTKDCIGAFPVYTTPPQRTWVGLTKEELQKILQEVSGQGWKPLLESIEAKLKEKNGYDS